jgi:hypothetical protein
LPHESKEAARLVGSLTAKNASQSDGAGTGRRRAIKERAAAEGRRFLVLFLYLWAMFALFALHERIVLRQVGVSVPAQGFAFVNALVLAKVMLIAEDLNLGGWLQGKPLLWPILHESVVFALLFIAVHYLEHIIVGLFQGETVRASVPAIGGGGIAGLVCAAVIMAVSLIPFFAFRDVNRALGGNRLVEMVLGTRHRRGVG